MTNDEVSSEYWQPGPWQRDGACPYCGQAIMIRGEGRRQTVWIAREKAENERLRAENERLRTARDRR